MTKALKSTNKFSTTYTVKLENPSSVQSCAKKAKDVIITLTHDTAKKHRNPKQQKHNSD